MSSRLALIIMALTSFWPQKSASVADLLLKDQVAEAEAQLNKEARTAGTIALRGEIEYRKGNLDQAGSLYQQALKMDSKSARAHFGLGKLAMAKLKDKEAVQEMARAIALEPGEPLYRLYASEAYALQKNYTEQMKQLQEYIRMNPNDPVARPSS